VTLNLVTFPTPSTAFFQLSFPLLLTLHPLRLIYRFLPISNAARETTAFPLTRKLYFKLFPACITLPRPSLLAPSFRLSAKGG
jgi:hypothetical protein